ncbi:MAG: FAD-dependent oxidoreductase [Candidatus Binatia bacterium]
MKGSPTFKHLLSPGRIGALEMRNRIVMSPMGSNLAEADGYVGERIVRYYEARARGGVGLIIVGVGAIAYPVAACIPNQVAISNDVFLPGLRTLTERVHAHGAKIAIQLQHAGKVATQDMAVGRPVWVPSVPTLTAGDLLNDLTQEEAQGVVGYLMKPGAALRFHEMSAADIDTVITTFADAADRARRAGFDGVEIHAAHGYLIAEFLSPATNHRCDEYGGSLENRARLMVEVIRAVRQRVGADFPVWCRLDAKEFRIANGISVEDAQRAAELAAAAGADAMHVSAYADPTSGVAFTDAPLVDAPCGYVALAEGIKRRVNIPIIAVGRIEPDEADAIIAGGKADFVAMARKLLADPELPNKLREGRAADVRPCVYSYTCVSNIFVSKPSACAVNPASGREAEYEITPAAQPKRVLIVGGGPAGMEAARVAALRGHRVTLCEQHDQLGGTLRFAALTHEPNAQLLAYLQMQVQKLPIEIRLRQAVTAAFVEQLEPDVILVATGGRRRLPALPGADRANVLSSDQLCSGGTELLRSLGKRVVVIGGSIVGIQIAALLSARGHEVSVIEEGKTLAVKMALPRRWRVLHTLRERSVRLLTESRAAAITDGGVDVTTNGDRQTVPADSVIVVARMEEDHRLAEALSTRGGAVHLIGDCRRVGYLEGALTDAVGVARTI